jgi:hypothetical protein
MEVLTPVILILGLLVAIVALIPGFRSNALTNRAFEWQQTEAQLRAEQDRERERRQLDADAPRIVVAGASWHGVDTDALPHRLNPVDKIDVSIQSVGKSAPQDVRAVLFPARVYNPQSGIRSDYLNGLYWEGWLDASPPFDKITPIHLKRQTRPLQGDQCVIDGLPLFAPDEPDLRPDSASTDPWLYARLTVTYSDGKTTFCVVYDAEAIQRGRDFDRVWRPVEGPVVVSKSIQKLTDETKREGDAQS